MKKIFIERNIVVALFIIVLIVFSFANRDTNKLFENNRTKHITEMVVPVPRFTAAIVVQTQPPGQLHSNH